MTSGDEPPRNMYVALIQLAKGRRGRTLIISAVFVVVLVGLVFQTSAESLSYKSLSNLDYLSSWRPKGSTSIPEPKEIFAPSEITLALESGELKYVPSHLKKKTPDFHLLIPATNDNFEFCKTIVSAMILNYPAATVINLEKKFRNTTQFERAKIEQILKYLEDKSKVRDEDLVMIVDGYDVYFQLPSEVLVKQYQTILAQANQRLRDQYGDIYPKDEPARPMFNQTVVWGADKKCWSELDKGCPIAPESPMPTNLYGLETDKTEALSRAKYLNAGTVIGPAKDLRAIFKDALPRMVTVNGTEPTAQRIFSTLFAEQEIARLEALKTAKSRPWHGWLSKPQPTETNTTTPAPLLKFSMGLDYTHSLFQPVSSTAPQELVSRPHSELQTLHHADTPTPALTLPSALLGMPPPYHTLDPAKDRSPNPLPYLTKPLQHNDDLDSLPNAKKGWAELPLWTNTYTGAVPALLHLNHPIPPPSASKRDENKEEEGMKVFKVDWKDLWFHPHARALTRAAMRVPQGSLAWHAAAVGGDALWDTRGGVGGVWTMQQNWLGFNEEGGVCKGREMVDGVFGDGKGIWLKEGEEERLKAEEEEMQKAANAQEEMRKKAKAEEEERKKQEEEVKKKLEEAERKKKAEEEKSDGEKKKLEADGKNALPKNADDKIRGEKTN